MSVNKIYSTEPLKFKLSFTEDPLLAYEKTFADIQNVKICLKKVPTDADDAYFQKYEKDENGDLTNAIVRNEPGLFFIVEKTEEDVVPVYGTGYKWYVGVKLSDYTNYIWLRINQEHRLIVEEDGIKE